MHILAINGAPEVDGTIAELTTRVARAAVDEGAFRNSSVEVDRANLREVMRDFHDGSFDMHPDWFLPFVDRIKKADAIALVCGINWGFPQDRVVSFMSQLTPLEHRGRFALEGKVVGILTHDHEGGAMDVAGKLAHDFTMMGCEVPPNGSLWINKFMKGESEKNHSSTNQGWMEFAPEWIGQVMVRAVLNHTDTHRGMDWKYRS